MDDRYLCFSTRAENVIVLSVRCAHGEGVLQ
jgi:hypothetical protein